MISGRSRKGLHCQEGFDLVGEWGGGWDCLSSLWLRRLIFLIDSPLDYCSTAWRPSFTNAWLGHFTFLQGNEGRLQCNQSAAPHPTFQWFRNGVLVTSENSSGYDILPDGTLVIKRVDKQLDEGNFTCKAQNFLGEDSSSAVVVVNGKFPRRANERTKIHHLYHHAKSRSQPLFPWSAAWRLSDEKDSWERGW